MSIKSILGATCTFLFVCVSIYSSLVFAQTPDGETPANEGVCDSLIGLTPGLYGLCVGFCEAQDCEATWNPETSELTFDASCKPSNPKILENYNKRAQSTDPLMPCLNIVEPPTPPECICWTEDELDNIADAQVSRCTHYAINGYDYQGRKEYVYSELGLCQVDFYNNDDRIIRYMNLTWEQQLNCRQSLVTECESRGY